MPNQRSNMELVAKFLNEDALITSNEMTFDEIIQMPISAFNFFIVDEEAFIRDILGIKTIGDFLPLDTKNPFKALSEELREKATGFSATYSSFKENFKKAILISTIIERLKDKPIINRPKQKVVVVGLDNAGKTALMSKLGNKLGIVDLALLKPTAGINRKEVESNDTKIIFWDFGGQESYRTKYLSNPEAHFLNIDLLLYVIDIQDRERYKESMEYFEKIIKTLIETEDNPTIIVFLHKFDPEIQNNDKVLLSVELIKDLVRTIFKGTKFNYEMYLTSIYSKLSKEPEFSKLIKDLMPKESLELTDLASDKLKEVDRSVGKLLEGLIFISGKIGKIEERLVTIEDKLEIRYALTATPKFVSSSLPPPVLSPSTNVKRPVPPMNFNKAFNKDAGIFYPEARNLIISQLNDVFSEFQKFKNKE